MQELRWPESTPMYGAVWLRAFEDRDAPMLRDQSTDRYLPTIGSLPANASEEDALAYIARQQTRLPEGIGFSFCVADRDTDEALGGVGLWVGDLSHGHASVGYAVAPKARGHGVARDALNAVVAFAWTLDGRHRLEARIEPWNTASIRTAEGAGFEREGLLRSHEEVGDRPWTFSCTRCCDPTTDGALDD